MSEDHSTQELPSQGDEASAIGRSTAGVTLLMFSQIFTKLSTFLLNQLLIRFISPEVFGVATYLEFLVSTVLFFSREAERLAVQRTKVSTQHSAKEVPTRGVYTHQTHAGTLQSIINFGYVPLAIGIPIAAIIFYLQLQTHIFQQTLSTLAYSHISILLTVASVFLELLAEPIYAINQYHLNFKRRSKFESTAVTLRCLATFTFVIVSKKIFLHGGTQFEGEAVLAFALGQFMYSLTLFVCYQASFYKDNNQTSNYKNSLLVSPISHADGKTYYLNTEVWQIWKSIFVQMIFKHFLTEGDKLVTSYLCTVAEQGVYSVVTNYGSIVARLLLQPIEESLRLLFTKILADKNKENLNKSYRIMGYLCLFYSYLSVLICLGGYTNASYLLQILIGGRLSRWNKSNVFQIFPQYILYLPFLAFNGIAEAFFSSASTESDIKSFSLFMSLQSLAVFGASYLFIGYFQLGLSGLILANVFNMLMRIGYCSVFTRRFYLQNGIKFDSKIAFKRLTSSIFLALVAGIGQYYFLGHKLQSESLEDFLKSASFCFMLLVVILVTERDLLKTPFNEVRARVLKQKRN